MITLIAGEGVVAFHAKGRGNSNAHILNYPKDAVESESSISKDSYRTMLFSTMAVASQPMFNCPAYL